MSSGREQSFLALCDVEAQVAPMCLERDKLFDISNTLFYKGGRTGVKEVPDAVPEIFLIFWEIPHLLLDVIMRLLVRKKAPVEETECPYDH